MIKAEMKNYKLISGLNDAGVVIENFYIDLDRHIFKLLMIDEGEWEIFYLVYDKHMMQLEELHVEDFWENLNDLAFNLYIDILSEEKARNKCKG